MGTPLLTLAVLAFIASTMAYALWPLASFPPMARPLWSTQPLPPAEVDLVWLFLHPRDPGMLALLVAVWAGLGYHLLRLWLELRRIAQARQAARVRGRALAPHLAGPPVPGDMLRQHGHDNSLAEHAPMIVAMLAGAVWPWLLAHHPITAFVLSVIMLAGTLAAALRGLRLGVVTNGSSTLGFVAGWALLVCLADFAGLLEQRLAAPQPLAVGLTMLIGAVAAANVQLRMPKRTGFSVALIWGLIGIAASTVTSDAAIATATVVAIAIIAVALVRVTT